MATHINRALFGILAALMLATASLAPAQEAGSYTIDRSKSDALTEYLHKNRLPLVGAQVSTSDDGGQQVTLYGFVASNLGKTNAEKRTRHFLNRRGIVVINRIAVRPEIRDLRRAQPKGEEEEASPEDPNKDPWAEIMREINKDRITLPDDNDFGPP